MNVDDQATDLVASWLRMAGTRVAVSVATGEVCDRCARTALRTIGLAGGIGAVPIAEMLVVGYGSTLRELVAAAVTEVFGDELVESEAP